MNYEQLRIAVMDAHRQGDQSRCLELMDGFIRTAQGSELGYALRLKASFLMLTDSRRSMEGLSLIEEALSLDLDDPVLQMMCIIDGLGLCYHSGDVQRSARYDALGHRLLNQCTDNPNVNGISFYFYFNLAHIASLKQEHAQAYWHLIQGTRAVLASPAGDSDEVRCMLFKANLRTAEVCLQLNRTPEANDALTKAQPFIASEPDELSWRISRADYLLATNQPDQAAHLLDDMPAPTIPTVSPTTVVRFHLTRGLTAQAQGDLRAFHHHLATAQGCAVDHFLDHLLSRIQRVMRTPTRLEAIR
ncbi:MAG TPA: hypothetical protein VD969_10145 [Symbiobacteriaceae bacterium]|nr:hypothetical protein [Symbiobacteriaceae bacterium]